MGKGLHNLARVLEVAEELHREGSLSKPSLIKLVDAADTSLNDEKQFIKELQVWALDLMQMDDLGNVLDIMKKVLVSFLQSPDADDHSLRGNALEVFLHFEKLLVAANNYDQEQIALKLMNNGQEG